MCNPTSHFRLDGVCEPCPVNPWLLPVMMASAAIGSGVAMYIFTKMKVNMTAINIGVDYFQVLSIFRKSKVKWPEEIRELLKQMQWFNFDIDMTGPECAFRSFFTYEMKWWLKVLMPFVAITIATVSILTVSGLHFLCSCGGKKRASRKKQGEKGGGDGNGNGITIIKKSSRDDQLNMIREYQEKKEHKKNRDKNRVPMWATMSSTFLTIVVFVYLIITRTAVGVFNCQQTKPKSGRTYMADKPLEECWVEGGLQSRLIIPAACVLIFYCIGFPILIFIVYYCNRKKIFDDQMLRARGTGDDKNTNSDYLFRKSFSKLYFMFKPSFYW
jgi:hypothetical protein